MSEDIKKTPEEETAENGAASENSTETGKALEEELSALRDTFQEKYDETVNEADYIAPIQGLEHSENEEPEEEEESDAPEETKTDDNSKKDKKSDNKPVKKHRVLKIVLPIVIILIIAPLLTFFILSVTNENFSAAVSAYVSAQSVDEYKDKISALENALTACKGDGFVDKALKNLILEDIIKEEYENEGYSVAYNHMKSSLSADELKSPSGSTMRKLVKISNQVAEIANKAFPLVIEKAKAAGDGNPDYNEICTELKVPSGLSDAVSECLYPITEGVKTSELANSDTNADFLNSISAAINSYYSAYSAFTAIGANADALAEQVVIALFDAGYTFESYTFSHGVFNNADREVIDSKLNDVLAFADNLSSYNNKIYETAVSAIETGKKSLTDCASLISGLPEKETAILARLVNTCVSGIELVNSKNLTKASTQLGTLLSVLSVFKLSDSQLAYNTVKCIFDSGDIPTADSQSQTYLTDEVIASLTPEQQKYCEHMKLVFAALNTASGVFSPYFQNYYYGGEIDFDKLSEELDATITDSSNNYDKAFVDYCKYYAASYTERKDAVKYIESMQNLAPDLPFAYGYFLLDEYTKDGKISEAAEFAKKLLDINTADDYANATIALSLRASGDLNASYETALKGIELAGDTVGQCTKHAAIALMLQGKFDEAYSYVMALYNSSLTVDYCDLVLVFNSVYKGENSEILSGLESTVAEINKTYSDYGAESLSNTTAILKGEKTLEDVFLSGSYDLR